MENSAVIKAKEKYDCLFSSEDKVKAFDQLAEKYYFANFGSTSKSDLDTMMFSFYIERILAVSEYESAMITLSINESWSNFHVEFPVNSQDFENYLS